jgi:hypothetical protein
VLKKKISRPKFASLATSLLDGEKSGRKTGTM